MPAMGATVVKSVLIAPLTSACRPADEATWLGWAIAPKAERIEEPAPVTTCGPRAMIPIRPAIRTSAALRSWLLATWPRRRASFLRLAVGFSVLS